MNERVKILTDSAIVVNRVAQLLDEENIPSIVRDNVESARLAGFGTSSNDVELYIRESDFDKAELIIESFFKERNQQ